MVIERDEAEADETGWPEADLNAAVCPLIEVVFAHTRAGSPERAAAMTELLESVARVKAALVPRPRLN